jgi:hypothetical protein
MYRLFIEEPLTHILFREEFAQHWVQAAFSNLPLFGNTFAITIPDPSLQLQLFQMIFKILLDDVAQALPTVTNPRRDREFGEKLFQAIERVSLLQQTPPFSLHREIQQVDVRAAFLERCGGIGERDWLSEYFAACAIDLCASRTTRSDLVRRVTECIEWVPALLSPARKLFEDRLVSEMILRLFRFGGRNYPIERRIAAMLFDVLPDVTAYVLSKEPVCNEATAIGEKWATEKAQSPLRIFTVRHRDAPEFMRDTAVNLPKMFADIQKEFELWFTALKPNTRMSWQFYGSFVTLKIAWAGKYDIMIIAPLQLAVLLAHVVTEKKLSLAELNEKTRMEIEVIREQLKSVSQQLPLMLITGTDVQFNPAFQTKDKRFTVKAQTKKTDWPRLTQASEDRFQNVYEVLIIQFVKKQQKVTREQIIQNLELQLSRSSATVAVRERALNAVLTRLLDKGFLQIPPNDSQAFQYVDDPSRQIRGPM